MKRYLSIIIAALLAAPAFSQHMLIEKSNSENNIINMEDFRCITFEGSNVNVIQANGSTITTPMSEINRVLFGDFTGIESTTAGDSQFITYISSDEIAVNSTAGEVVSIYNINGSLIFQLRLQETNGSISIARLPKGIYLLQVAGKTAKFIKR